MAGKVIVGLGNPGPQYAETRHNVGFQFVDYLARKHNITFSEFRFNAHLALGTIKGQEVILVKPLTFMNLSGQAVKPLVKSLAVPLHDLLVVYDDMDLPVGAIRFRPKGGAGGHRGMRSIIEALGHQDFPRLRFGIGRPIRGDPVDYVLGEFSEEEKAAIALAFEKAVDVVEGWVEKGLEEALRRFSLLTVTEG
ncbi:MAG: aminoacyl-tRNA hydrolase [Anaerolineae bacterium]|nr:aminoacyl-tRNA hydrolase [Anaerolineae bacterium]MDW8102229.1 aminoacyl-tRNA hydrolase [Anaerolineae bacterium]